MEKESSYLFVYGTLVILYLENQRKCHYYCLKLLFLSFKNVVFSEDCFGTKHVTNIFRYYIFKEEEWGKYISAWLTDPDVEKSLIEPWQNI